MRKHSSTTKKKILYIANQTQISNQTFDTKTERMNTTRRCIVERKKNCFFSIRFWDSFFFFSSSFFCICFAAVTIFSNFILCTFILSLEMSQTARIKNQRTDFLLFIVFLVFISFFFFIVTSLLPLGVWCDEKCDNFYVVFLPQFDELLLFCYCYFLLSGTI